MKKHAFLLAAISLALPLSANAAFNVIVNSNGGPKYVDSGGADMSGAWVRAGTFSDTTNIANFAAVGDLASIEALFTAFGEDGATTNDGTPQRGGNPVSELFINDVASAGHIGATGYNNVDQAYAGGNGTRIYVWVYNVAPADASPAPAGMEIGIFGANEATWTVPALGVANLATLNINDPSEVIYGRISQGGLHTLPIPEPSTLAALLVGMTAFGLRRRRA